MSDPKPSPNDILSKIRAQKAAAAAGSEPTAEPKAEAAAAPAAAPPAPAAAAQAPSAPRSPADIMASIRSAGKPAAAAAATPAAAKPAAAGSAASIMDSIRSAGKPAAAAGAPAAAPAASAAPAPAAVVPAGLSPAEMIKAARSAESGAPVAPKVVLPTKPLPGKAAPTATKAAAEVSRRSVVGSVVATLCSPLVVAWGSFSAAAAASGLALARFMMPNVLVEPPTKFKIGPPTDYAPGTVSTKWQAQFNIWVVNSDVDGVRSIYALSTVCTHLGCTPNWLEGEQKFKCPCHGSGFYKSGINFEGPAPRPLERVGLRLAEDGMLEVDKSVKFQRELGQWTNSSSFVSTG
ncbi:MAG: ubiquinol-cytochrome c reductase iron-sulfur subunit [Planctomyces sp.]